MTIRRRVVVRASPERCFDLTRSVDFHVASSQRIAARADGGRRLGLSEPGDTTRWSARFLGVRFSMTTRIDDFVRPVHFSDRQSAGLLRRFEHVYTFEPVEGGCAVTDTLTVEAPFGPLGRLVEQLYLERTMRSLVASRLEAIRRTAED